MSKKKRKFLKAGDITSYKLPVIKGEEGERFYSWLNNPKRSINGIITEALKLKYMLDNMNLNKKKFTNNNITLNEIYDIDNIDEIEFFNVEKKTSLDNNSSDLEAIIKTINSVKR